MCVFQILFFVFVITFWYSKTASISFDSISVHSEGQHLRFPLVFKSKGINDMRIEEKREFLYKIGF